MKKYILFLLLVFLNFNVCNADATQNNHQAQKDISIEDDEMLYEFEDEFADDANNGSQNDPLSEYNRLMTTVNDRLYENVFTPISNGYVYLINKEVRKSVDNFFNNLYFPPRFVNNLLQGKFKYASEEALRFIINSTLGVLGLFDVAKIQFDLQEHTEDFGQTLGFYGVGSGPHIVLPIFGPSNLRDSLGMIPDSYISPFDFKDRKWFTVTDTYSELVLVKSYENINSFSLNKDKYEKIREDAVDLYPYMRNMYEQYRDNQIKE